MSEWAEAARRGQLAVEIMTVRRARNEGFLPPADHAFLALIKPDDGKPFAMWLRSTERAAEFLAEMQPHFCAINGMPDEDQATIVGALSGHQVKH